MNVLDAAAMRALDARESAARGATSLMRDAGDAIAGLVPRYANAPRVIGIAGPGNNGGDVFAALASTSDAFSRVVYAMDAPNASEARRDAQMRAAEAGVTVRPIAEFDARALSGAGLVLDGLLGVGARPSLSGEIARAADAVNRSGERVLAIDVPSGTDATTGEADSAAIRATATVTIGAVKRGLTIEPTRERVGELWLAAIGMSPQQNEAVAEMLDRAEWRRLLPRRDANSEKRSAGAPLIVAGSEQFPGAAVLCTRAAARAGAGYVTVATPRAAAASLRSHLIEQVVVTFDESDPEGATQTILDLSNHCSSIAIGPGLGLGDALGAIVRGVIERTTLPVVVDASGLFHLAKHLDIVRDRAIVLTPHAGEFARLSGKGTLRESDRASRLRAFVEERHVTTLLKGQMTLIDDGHTLHINPTGSSALATAGTGDVLTGIVATLLAQGLPSIDAARVAAYWHGLAGKLAGKDRAVGVIAGDVPDYLARAVVAATEQLGGAVRLW